MKYLPLFIVMFCLVMSTTVSAYSTCTSYTEITETITVDNSVIEVVDICPYGCKNDTDTNEAYCKPGPVNQNLMYLGVVALVIGAGWMLSKRRF